MLDAEKLIFLISAPRSGSSLLQHMLASHSQICTAPEPWLLLGLAYQRTQPFAAEYNSFFARTAVNEFFADYPDAHRRYTKSLSVAVREAYGVVAQQCGKTYFLDKTTRYYLILPFLQELFPRARFVFLIRNPLAIASSILHTNFNGDLTGFDHADRQHDLYSAPVKLRDAAKCFDGTSTVIHYEQLVTDTADVLRTACDDLGLEFENAMTRYQVPKTKTSFIDPATVRKHTKPEADFASSWIRKCDSPSEIDFLTRYLYSLPERCVEGPGYDRNTLQQQLQQLSSKVSLRRRAMFQIGNGCRRGVRKLKTLCHVRKR